MRRQKWLMIVAGLGIGLLVDTGPIHAQRFGPSSRGGGSFDPESRWAELVQSSGGSGDTIVMERLPPESRDRLRRFATFSGQAPLPESGVLTKQQYMDYMTRGIQGIREKGGFGGMGGPPGSGGPPGMGGPGSGGPPGFGGPGAGGPPGMGGPGSGSMFSRGSSSPEEIARRFAEYDVNKDGRISFEEASDRTKQSFPTFDVNKDGFLDLQEYTAYRQGGSSGPPGFGGPPGFASAAPQPWPSMTPPQPAVTPSTPARKGEDPALVAYRYGKIPKEAPSWFTDLDTDRDGQLGLYEWKKAGKDMIEFATLDLNADGFVTAEEWIRAQKIKLEQTKQDELVASVADGGPLPESSAGSRTSSSSSSSGSSSPGSGRGMWGSRGPGGGGPPSRDSRGDGERKRPSFGGGFPFKK